MKFNKVRFFKICLMLIAFIYSEKSICQVKSSELEVNQIRFKTKELKNILSHHIAEFKKTYKIDPKTIIIYTYEKIKKAKNENDEYIETTDLMITIEIAVNYFTVQEDIMWYGNFSRGMVFENTTILLRDKPNLKNEKDLFFIDSIKILVPLNLGVNVTSREWTYLYKNYTYKFIETFSIEDIYNKD